ncbi:CapA family protein [Pontibacter oryzae]|uniref:CapA family protein n=2 Tax=Pontibacter oryzae TaxID=2304593 RepID=A0A399SG79_9BACT|nr:CapA family protein [Pontibacter oryzae]
MPQTGEQVALKLFLGGDVMLGRGIDQVMPYSVLPELYETYVKDARTYVRLAEKTNGLLPLKVSFSYPWGDALGVFQRIAPDVKLINLETSVTTNATPWPDKVVCYRMHPKNVSALSEAGIDFCSLSNNHVLDWQRAGLTETLKSLRDVGIAFAGAGKNLSEAQKPAILPIFRKNRLIILSYSSESSGVPAVWAATATKPGINLLPDYSRNTVALIKRQVAKIKHPGDVVLFSMHWGPNWGYTIPQAHQKFAHALIDKAGVDLLYGHSSHHPLGMEVYNGKLILYGTGDLINDYEGIKGHEKYRPDLAVMYFPEINGQTGNLVSLTLVPMQIRKFRLNSASQQDSEWLAEVLDRESAPFGARVALNDDRTMALHW